MNPAVIEVNLLSYRFRFRALAWRESFILKPQPKLDRRRQLLAKALLEISGLPITSFEDALKVFNAISLPIIERIFVVYRGSLRPDRIFKTQGLYRAPAAFAYTVRMEEAEQEQQEQAYDKVGHMLEDKFGRHEIVQAREIEKAILEGSKMRGATPATPPQDYGKPPSKN